MTTQPMKSIVLDLLQQGHRDAATFVEELGETERTVSGTAHCWSAKDHLAHRIFWQQDLMVKVTALLQQQEIPPREADDDQINARVFEEHQQRLWSDLYAESERVYAVLLALIESLSEADLTDPERFAALTRGKPLYTAFLGGCYEHDQEHLAQYYSDRNALARAIEIREQCANRVMQAEVPIWVKGRFLYNLACFYAQHQQREKASALLSEALACAPDLQEQSRSDPDLAALRDSLA